jgi:hypothetical protein
MTLNRSTPLKARKPMAAMSAKKRAVLAESGIVYPTSTLSGLPSELVRKPKMATAAPKAKPRAKYTGPKRSVCVLVDIRSDKRCEFPGCDLAQDHRHHRLNRKAGGRKGEMRERINQAAWLLGVCAIHHEIVTNPPPGMIETIKRMGWILVEGQDATQVEVFTRHQVDPVFLDNSGQWHDYAEVAA